MHNTFVALPFGMRMSRKSLYLGIGTFVVVLALLGTLLLYAAGQYTEGLAERADWSSETVAAPEAVEVVLNSSEEATSLESILEKYRTAVGLSEVKGMVFYGNYMADGRDHAMKLMVKPPKLVRKILTDENLQLVTSSDGDQVTLEVKDTGGELHPHSPSNELYKKVIMLEGAALSLVSNPLPDVLVYKREADQMYQGRNCWTIRREVSEEESMIHLIDIETGFELLRFIDFMVEGRPQQLSLHLSDYRQQGQSHIPFLHTLQLNGEVGAEARIDSVRLNPGLMAWMFSEK